MSLVDQIHDLILGLRYSLRLVAVIPSSWKFFNHGSLLVAFKNKADRVEQSKVEYSISTVWDSKT